MKIEKKYKIVYWAVIFLAILNISTIATIFINSPSSLSEEEDSIIIDPESSPLSGKYVKAELNFNQSQLESYRNESRIFRHNANDAINKLNYYKSMLSQEVHNDNPNREITKLYSDSIGIAHANLKEITTDFYLKLREKCTPEQVAKLENIFEPLFRDNPNIRGAGARTGEGVGRGNRRNRINNQK